MEIPELDLREDIENVSECPVRNEMVFRSCEKCGTVVYHSSGLTSVLFSNDFVEVHQKFCVLGLSDIKTVFWKEDDTYWPKLFCQMKFWKFIETTDVKEIDFFELCEKLFKPDVIKPLIDGEIEKEKAYAFFRRLILQNRYSVRQFLFKEDEEADKTGRYFNTLSWKESCKMVVKAKLELNKVEDIFKLFEDMFVQYHKFNSYSKGKRLIDKTYGDIGTILFHKWDYVAVCRFFWKFPALSEPLMNLIINNKIYRDPFVALTCRRLKNLWNLVELITGDLKRFETQKTDAQFFLQKMFDILKVDDTFIDLALQKRVNLYIDMSLERVVKYFPSQKKDIFNILSTKKSQELQDLLFHNMLDFKRLWNLWKSVPKFQEYVFSCKKFGNLFISSVQDIRAMKEIVGTESLFEYVIKSDRIEETICHTNKEGKKTRMFKWVLEYFCDTFPTRRKEIKEFLSMSRVIKKVVDEEESGKKDLEDLGLL